MTNSQPSSRLVARLLAAGLLPVDALSVARAAEEAGDVPPSYLDADAEADRDVVGTYENSRAWWLTFVARHERLRTYALLLEARRDTSSSGGDQGRP